MFGNDNPNQPPPDPGERIAGLVSTILALIITFFAFPTAFQGTVDAIEAFSIVNYGFGGGFIRFCWGMIAALCLFALSKLGIYFGIRLLIVWLAE